MYLLKWRVAVLFWILFSVNGYVGVPTPREIERAFTIKGDKYWGQQMRKENCTRLLVIGGSECAMERPKELGIVQQLHKFLKEEISNCSYALNRAKGSTGPAGFVGISYDWENWDVSLWPNVIMLDFTKNTEAHEGWKSAQNVMKIIRGINSKYTALNLTHPDVVMLELTLNKGMDDLIFSPRKINMTTTEQRLTVLNNFSKNISDTFFVGNGFNRGCVSCAYFNEFAQFYGYPVISFRNAAYPAYLRNLVNGNGNWFYIGDSIHLSDNGRIFLQKYIMRTFWLDAMKPRKEEPPASKYSVLYEHDIRMFAEESTLREVARWTSWGHEKNTLRELISRDNNRHEKWHFQSTIRHEHDKGHICYGSRHNNTSTRLTIPKVYTECTEKTPCSMMLTSIYSWNSTHFGSMNCKLLDSQQSVLTKIDIDSRTHNGVNMRNTAPADIVLYDQIINTTYAIECTKVDNKHSCITGVKIVHYV